ncbi:MAG: SGNH/GDSL hydrolase family protein [Pseudorhodoplanes sp.]
MKGWSIAGMLLAALCSAGAAHAQQKANICDVPAYLLFSDIALNRVAAAVGSQKRLNIAVIGTVSSSLGATSKAYPARLEEALRNRLPGIVIEIETQVMPRQSAAEMVGQFAKFLSGKKPVLAIWQVGTVDAMRGIEPEDFRTALDEGVEMLQAAGADVILMNMQYSPRTESMIALGTYVDSMRLVSRDRDAPLFDRLSIMRHWSESGDFDLSAATKDSALAERVHDCIGRALAAMIIDAAQLGAVEAKAPK